MSPLKSTKNNQSPYLYKCNYSAKGWSVRWEEFRPNKLFNSGISTGSSSCKASIGGDIVEHIGTATTVDFEVVSSGSLLLLHSLFSSSSPESVKEREKH